MEGFNYFVLTFKEALSVLFDFENVELERYSIGGLWDSGNAIDENSLKNILSNAYSLDFDLQTEEQLQNVPFLKWESNTYKFIDPFMPFFKHLFKEYGNSYCVYSDSDQDNDLIKGSINLMDNLLNMFVVTFPKYKELYTALETEKNNLLRGVTATTENKGYNKFKDTPQGPVSMEQLDSDNMNTNVTIQENENTYTDERDTPVARIKEIQERYVNLYEEWAHEFKAFFWEG